MNPGVWKCFPAQISLFLWIFSHNFYNSNRINDNYMTKCIYCHYRLELLAFEQ